MKIHEHQAKSILAACGIPIPDGAVASSPAGAASIAARLGRPVVLKAQILAGGRGRAGGVRTAATPSDAARLAAEMLGARLLTRQTDRDGLPVRRLLVEESVPAAREAYLALAVDRRAGQAVLLASGSGGMDVEALAISPASGFFREPVAMPDGPSTAQIRRAISACGYEGAQADGFAEVVACLWRAFRDSDATLAEINPLAWNAKGFWTALDAKLVLDDAALPRHPEWAGLRDAADDDPREAEAAAAGLSYVRLEGDIGCLVNGAGLAMATADMIRLAGGHPADFLDIGGGVGEEALVRGFRIVSSDPAVKAVLVNVFGGIVRCDLVARAVVRAAADSGRRPPLVVRMLGTNAEEGRRILAESGLAYEAAETLDEAAAKAVAAAAGARR